MSLLLALFFFLDSFAFLNIRINCVIVCANIGARVRAIQSFQLYLHVVVILVRRCEANFRARARLKCPLHAHNKYLEALPTAKVRTILKHVICVGVQGPV